MSTVFSEKYQAFCASPLRTRKDIAIELDELRRNPNIAYLAFHKPHILAVGTRRLCIPWQGDTYVIGECIIFFIRKRIEKMWETGFFVANPTGALPRQKGVDCDEGVFIHPHILLCDYDDIKYPVGELCISAGQFVIYQSIRLGKINTAFSHLWRALQTYGTGQPFLEIGKWPKLAEK